MANKGEHTNETQHVPPNSRYRSSKGALLLVEPSFRPGMQLHQQIVLIVGDVYRRYDIHLNSIASSPQMSVSVFIVLIAIEVTQLSIVSHRVTLDTRGLTKHTTSPLPRRNTIHHLPIPSPYRSPQRDDRLAD